MWLEHVVKSVLKVYFGIFYRVRIRGMENIPKEGGLILCANHVGQLDMFFIAYKIKRLVHFMAKAELFDNPVLKWFLSNVGAFPVKRGTGDIGAAKAVYKLLKNGEIVGIMPEGHRTKGKERLKAKNGATMFALSADVPIVPVGIRGKYRLFSEVTVNIGKPYKPDFNGKGKPTQEELDVLSQDLMNKIYTLVEE